MIKPNFKLNVANTSGNYAEIHIEPLEKGFGHTLGNALRRVLLTSLEGAAATTVKIDGVSHQFSTLSGLQENIIEFVLGLKGVHFQVEGDGPFTAKIDSAGKKEITAADIECPAGVSVTNPEHRLGLLTNDKAKLKATITIEKGVGYVPADEHASNEIGVIPLDSVFTPVISSSYSVETTRVGRRADLDRIRLEVQTNGSLTPVAAVEKAAMILSAFFTQVYQPTFDESAEAVLGGAVTNPLHELPIEELDIPTRVVNALKKGGFKKLGDFTKADRNDMMKVKNLGEKSVQDVIKRLSKKGIEVK